MPLFLELVTRAKSSALFNGWMQCRQALSDAPEQKIDHGLREPATQGNLRSLFSTSRRGKLELL
jgi:hypothetical protein